MKKVALIFAALLLLLPLAASAQTVVMDEFNSLGEWVIGDGDWVTRGGMLIQRDVDRGMARIDRPLAHEGEFEISFLVRYEAGGFDSEADLMNNQLHGGFGIQIGGENPPLGRKAWGVGESYLLWLNLDTRTDTASSFPQHSGFRGQVWESESNSAMDITDMNVDIQAALAQLGIEMEISDIEPFLLQSVPMKIRVNMNTGRIMVNDPTNSRMWFWFDVDPDLLEGDYVSLRTNNLALRFMDFTVTEL